MNEYFYTFLSPIKVSYQGVDYYVYGYREVDNEVVSLSAITTPLTTPWTKSTLYQDKDLIKELVALLPEKPIKVRKRRKKKDE